MTEATITIEDVNGIKVVHIGGQLDESNIDEKVKDIYKVVEETPKGLSLIFELENLEYMNSKSIGYLTDLYGKITETGGKVAIASAKPNIVDILQVVGLTQLIQTFDTLEAAKMGLQATATAESAPAAPVEPTPAPAAPVEPTPAPVAPAEPTPAPAAPVEPTPAPAAPVKPTPAPPTPAEAGKEEGTFNVGQ